LAGMLMPAFAGWLAWPARIILTYMLDTAHVLSRIPHIFVQNLGFSWRLMIVSYCMIAGLTFALWWKRRPKNARITDRTSAERHTAGESLRSDARVPA
ncbi:MAG TPA: hypothetical protein VF261_02820, partial [Candidatus Saccharimonadales bacterium]